MTRFFAIAALLCSSVVASAMDIPVSLNLVASDFTGTFNAEATDVYQVIADNPNADPVFSLDLALDGVFSQVAGQPVVQDADGLIKVAGVIDAADSFFSVAPGTDLGDVLVAPGTTVDSEGGLAAAFTVAGNVPVLEGNGARTIAVLAVPAGTIPTLPEILGTAVVRGSAGGVSVNVVGIPEPTTVVLAGLAAVGFLARRK